MDRIVRIETVGEVAIATDEAGRQFVSPAGRWDWKPVDDPPPQPTAPPERRSLFPGRRRAARRS